jgi:hypothetical protein
MGDMVASTELDDPSSVEGRSDKLELALGEMLSKLPKVVRFRAQNALDHFDRALKLLPIDREMASFRAITGQEEAATALLRAIEYQNYPNWKKLNTRYHAHNAAVLLCAEAIQRKISTAVKQAQVVFDLEDPRIDIKIPLYGTEEISPNGGGFALQPVEPLDISIKLKSKNDEERVDLFQEDFQKWL